MPEKNSYIRDFWQFLTPYKKPLRVVYVLYFINSMLNLIPAYSVRYYLDLVILGNPVELFGYTIKPIAVDALISEKVFTSLVFLGAVLLLIVMANTVGVIMWRRGTWAVEKVMYDIKTKIHNHINRLSLGYLHSERVGAIMTKAVNDVEMLSQFLRNSFNLTYELVQLVIAPILMISLSPLLFAVSIVPVPLIMYAFYNIKQRLKPMYKEQRETQSNITSHVQETITGVREVKAFNIEDTSEKVYQDINREFFDIQNRIMRVFSFNHQLQYGSKDVGLILIAVIGGICMFFGVGNVSIGVISSFIALSTFMYRPVSTFLGFYDMIQRGLVAMERIIGFLQVKEDVKDIKGAVDLSKQLLKGRVEFRNVSFGYNKNFPVLNNISFIAEPGRKIAIVGPSGSGKSTLVSLLLRFYNTGSGGIYIDEVPITKFTQRSVRNNIGVVFQETFLFYGTILDNFRFVSPNASESSIVQACKLANVYDDIMALPEGFDTRVGERGAKLSGGQKQRIAIARVILKDPKIVILDEATSAVDTVTERLIQEGIDAMLQDRTAFIIAHRLSTIRGCDNILVIDGHTVAESGTHDELMQKKGIYFYLNQNDLAMRDRYGL